MQKKIYRYIREMLPSIPDYISVTPPYDEPVKKVRNIYNVSLLIKRKNTKAFEAFHAEF